jgi:hypothetical protein
MTRAACRLADGGRAGVLVMHECPVCGDLARSNWLSCIGPGGNHNDRPTSRVAVRLFREEQVRPLWRLANSVREAPATRSARKALVAAAEVAVAQFSGLETRQVASEAEGVGA